MVITLGILLNFQSLGAAQELDKAVSIKDEVPVLYQSAMTAKKKNDLLSSRAYLSKIIEYYPKYSKIELVKKEWGKVLFKIIHSKLLSPGVVLYKVLPGDSLEKIAKEHRTTIELIKQRNGLTENDIQEDQVLSIWVEPFSIVIDKGTNNLYLLLGKNIVKQYKVSTGKAATVTPLGDFTIKYRYPNPAWFHHGDIIPGGRVDNWLGTRWLGFDKPKYGIHGTIYPQLIGQSVSGGCVRMKNKDVEELYDMIPVGTKVTIIDSQTKLQPEKIEND